MSCMCSALGGLLTLLIPTSPRTVFTKWYSLLFSFHILNSSNYLISPKLPVFWSWWIYKVSFLCLGLMSCLPTHACFVILIIYLIYFCPKLSLATLHLSGIQYPAGVIKALLWCLLKSKVRAYPRAGTPCKHLISLSQEHKIHMWLFLDFTISVMFKIRFRLCTNRFLNHVLLFPH